MFHRARYEYHDIVLGIVDLRLLSSLFDMLQDFFFTLKKRQYVLW